VNLNGSEELKDFTVYPDLHCVLSVHTKKLNLHNNIYSVKAN